jgi:hypothetical protein
VRENFLRAGRMPCAFAIYAVEDIGHTLKAEYNA